MILLEKAQALVREPITAQTLIAIDELCGLAHGVEADRIGDMWETAMVKASQNVIEEYYLLTVGK